MKRITEPETRAGGGIDYLRAALARFRREAIEGAHDRPEYRRQVLEHLEIALALYEVYLRCSDPPCRAPMDGDQAEG